MVRQMLYLAITDTKELKIEKVADAQDMHDRLKGKNAKDLEDWIKERYPEAYRAYGEKKERNQLPSLKISSDKAKRGAAPQGQPGFAQLAGTWKVTYNEHSHRVYVIEGDGSIKVMSSSARNNDIGQAGTRGQLKRANDETTLIFADRLERFTLDKYGRLIVEHYNPKETYPDGRTTLIGIGMRQKK